MKDIPIDFTSVRILWWRQRWCCCWILLPSWFRALLLAHDKTDTFTSSWLYAFGLNETKIVFDLVCLQTHLSISNVTHSFDWWVCILKHCVNIQLPKRVTSDGNIISIQTKNTFLINRLKTNISACQNHFTVILKSVFNKHCLLTVFSGT